MKHCILYHSNFIPSSISPTPLPNATGQSSPSPLDSATAVNSSGKDDSVYQRASENPVHKLSSSEATSTMMDYKDKNI